ncbi:MAG: ATP-binding protein [Gemmatimonadales bacterium]
MTPTPTPVVLSWSGGKDSALALERLRADPAVEIVSLTTTVSAEYNRISMHGVRRSLLHRQVACLRLPLTEIELGAAPSNAAYEAGFAAGLARLQSAHPGVRTMAFGDLFLEEVRQYREVLLARSGWTGLYPLWGEPTSLLAQHFIHAGYRAVLSCVDTTQLDSGFAGREFDAQLLRDMPTAVDPCGERGEFHTYVYAGPIFHEPVSIRLGERVLRERRFQYCDLLESDAGATAQAAV